MSDEVRMIDAKLLKGYLINKIRELIDRRPTVEAEPVKHGRWIYDGDCMITSCCNTAYDINKFQNNNGTILVPTICPNCGAKMDLMDGDSE